MEKKYLKNYLHIFLKFCFITFLLSVILLFYWIFILPHYKEVNFFVMVGSKNDKKDCREGYTLSPQKNRKIFYSQSMLVKDNEFWFVKGNEYILCVEGDAIGAGEGQFIDVKQTEQIVIINGKKINSLPYSISFNEIPDGNYNVNIFLKGYPERFFSMEHFMVHWVTPEEFSKLK